MQVTPDSSTSDPSSSAKGAGLLRSSIITSGATLFSRVLGLVRETVFAALFGDGAAADAFFVAFKIPNFLRRLFAEGAFSQAFVPVLAEYRTRHDKPAVKRFIDHIAGSLSLILIIITVIGVIASPLVAALFAPGYLDDDGKFALLVEMLRITFPYLLLVSLTGFAGAILNSYGQFAAPAMTPIFLNITLIAAALLLSPYFAEPTLALAWGVLLSGLIQLMFLLPFLRHLRLVPRPRYKPKDEGVKKVISLMIPVMFSVSVGQINLLLDTVLATSIEGDGSVSWLYYSDRLMELPLGIFGIAIATVILPALSRIHSSGDEKSFARTLEWGMRSILVVGLPATIALIVLAEPMVVTLYQRGQFSVESVIPTSRSVQAYAVGLIAFMAIKILASAFFSRQDTRTPVRVGVISLVSNMVINLILIIPLAHVGLALATSISAFLNAGLLMRGLMKAGLLIFTRTWWILVLRIVVATIAMTLVLMLLGQATAQWIAWNDLHRIGYLMMLCTAGGLSYILILWLLGVRPAQFRA
ncbi:MAG: murein biosynthesis integral membrane protein MurJ [Pseudomonadota bacterium]